MTFRNLWLIANRRAVLTGSLLFVTVFYSSVAVTAPRELEKITVWGGNPTVKVVGRTSIAPIEETTLLYHVRFDDLDLTTSNGANALRERVIGAARHACDDLDKMHLRWSKDINCIRSAEKNARSQVEDAIKQAQHRR